MQIKVDHKIKTDDIARIYITLRVVSDEVWERSLKSNWHHHEKNTHRIPASIFSDEEQRWAFITKMLNKKLKNAGYLCFHRERESKYPRL